MDGNIKIFLGLAERCPKYDSALNEENFRTFNSKAYPEKSRFFKSKPLKSLRKQKDYVVTCCKRKPIDLTHGWGSTVKSQNPGKPRKI